MKQIIQSYKTGKMALEEVPRPQIFSGGLLVETKASVVSAGTEKMLVDLAKKSLIGKAKARPDLVKKVIAAVKKEGMVNTLEKVRSKLDTPIPLGYSCAGIVRHMGADVDTFQVGDAVACAGAGYANHAEFNLVPKNLCVKIPEARDGEPSNVLLSFEEAAFATVGAIALQGVRQAALTLGESVCVIGLGLLGQLTVQLCKANGCRVLGADIDLGKIELAKKLGVDEAVHSRDLEREVFKFTRGVGADAVIITAAAKGSELVALAGEICRIKGRVVVVGLVGLEVPRDVYYKKELDLRLSMSYGPGRYDAEYEERGHDYPLPYVRWSEGRNMQAFVELLAAGRVDVRSLITHRFPFERALAAYELITQGKEPFLGVVLEYEPRGEPKRIPVVKSAPVAAAGGVRLGVVGAGNFARSVLLPRFKKQEKVSLHGVITAKGMSAKAVAEQFGFGYCSGDVDEIFSDDDINTVLIATRHNLHGPLVVQAIEAGKHVFVEKPLCLDPGELERIVAACGSRSASLAPLLMVGFNRRFSPMVWRAAEVLKWRGTPLVASYQVNAGFVPKEMWVQDPVEGGGRIIGEVCHFVDTLRFLVGAPVRSVQAACIQTDDVRQVNRDSVAITLTYADGSVGTILYYAVGNGDYPKEKLELAADGVVIALDDYCKMDIWGKKREVVKGRQDKGFDAEVGAFVTAVVDGGAAPIPLEEIVETTQVTFAVHAALNSGETVRF
ncbi:bi-domain-containing oxidoreductase [Desulfoferrobacter suflitae]|uniref:bi-domain-containing oxidoreductase n=1 Tax=Desulfoferrobacter suflitae TaxID=2865782 RepID=UPI0021649CC1|nr:bi-domain-containing oxidoreductase [Desulfoferrobacter suflitae]MCK8603931.1 bi-domain-containing oxidoreductase [Desulfoferrobacter suflitae]